MNKKTSNMEVKRINRNRVFRYMNELEQTSMTEIAAVLKMSGPTVLTIVNELKDAGLVEEIGEFQSTGGRKAKAFATAKHAVYTLGVDITRRHVGIAYTNLARQTLQYERIWKIFENTEEYFEEVAELIQKFVKDNQIDEEKIAGMGLSMPGIVDRSRNHMTQSHVLGLSEINLENWTKYMPYPCEVMNDANAAAIAECHDLEKEGGVIYIALSNTVGGAVVFDANLKHAVDDNLYVGDNWRGGEFGHIMIRPDGRQCYCGKKGCFDAYCSAYQLEELSDKEHGKLEDFFAKLKEGQEPHRTLWQEYLENLSIAVVNLRMCLDCDVILGGYVGTFMEPYLEEFQQLVWEKDIFKDNKKYVRVGRYKKDVSALGAAIFCIDRYIAEI